MIQVFQSDNDISTNVNKQHGDDGVMIISKHWESNTTWSVRHHQFKSKKILLCWWNLQRRTEEMQDRYRDRFALCKRQRRASRKITRQWKLLRTANTTSLSTQTDVTATSKSINEKTLDTKLNVNASEFKPKRNAAAIARLKMQDKFKIENDLGNTD